MEGLYINLIKKQSINYLRLIAGVIMIGGTIYLGFFTDQQRFKIYHLVLFFIAGVYYAIMGAGINPFTAFGKAFIKVDKQTIAVKKSIYSKMTEVAWSEIEEIQINITAIRIKQKSNETFEFEYQMLDTDTVHELKTRLALTAKSLDVKVA
ncbi:MAG: hypothetical protein N4A74_08960 [Carboxylicivirga sp.]|jgi:hypothetical protein|nr:hypothetical protein [Carboxylicivirga sp.]